MQTSVDEQRLGERAGIRAVPAPGVVRDLRPLRFRASPSYELVPCERLSTGEREALRAFTDDPDFYGIFRPTGEGTIKKVGPDTALLFLGLGEAGGIPSWLRARLKGDCDRAIAQLVLDAVLEVDDGDGFVSGARAREFLYAAPPAELGTGVLARLSSAALQYGQGLPLTEPNALAHKLYTYNALPASPRWRSRLPDTRALEAFLGLRPGSDLVRLLGAHWKLSDTAAGRDGWLMWYSRQQRPPADAAVTYKLYLSPRPSSVPESFSRLVQVLADCGAPGFKVGATLHGIMRADKVVIYFRERAELETAAGRILDALAGVPVQGVPFTAEIGGEGLLSWGVDPAQERHRLAWEGPVSWRLFVTSRLARALLHARHESGPGLEPWRFALERLRLEGVDISTWTPMDPQRQTGDARGTSRAAAGSLDADPAIAAAKARDQ